MVKAAFFFCENELIRRKGGGGVEGGGERKGVGCNFRVLKCFLQGVLQGVTSFTFFCMEREEKRGRNPPEERCVDASRESERERERRQGKVESLVGEGRGTKKCRIHENPTGKRQDLGCRGNGGLLLLTSVCVTETGGEWGGRKAAVRGGGGGGSEMGQTGRGEGVCFLVVVVVVFFSLFLAEEPLFF